MKPSNMIFFNKASILISLSCIISIHTYGQSSDLQWCQGLYIGDIRVEPDDFLFTVRDELRSNVGAILSDIGQCNFNERDPGLLDLLSREPNYFSEATLAKIVSYRDKHRLSISTLLLGSISELQRNQYSLEMRIVNIQTFSSSIRFKYIFNDSTNFDFEHFNQSFKLTFLEEIGQLLTVTGRFTPVTILNEQNLDCTPEQLSNTFQLNTVTGRFQYKVPRYKFKHDSLNIRVFGTRIEGHLPKAQKIDPNASGETINAGEIVLTRTTGQIIDLEWQDGPLKSHCNDIEIKKIVFQSAARFQIIDSVYYTKNHGGFQLEIPPRLPTDTEVLIDFQTDNYPRISLPRFSLDQAKGVILNHGNGEVLSWRKFVPGLQQYETNQKLFGVGIILTEAALLYKGADQLIKSFDRQNRANNSTSPSTRDMLNEQAEDFRTNARLFLIAAGGLYLLQLWHGAKIRSCKSFKKNKVNYSIWPSYLAGSAGLGVSLGLGS